MRWLFLEMGLPFLPGWLSLYSEHLPIELELVSFLIYINIRIF